MTMHRTTTLTYICILTSYMVTTCAYDRLSQRKFKSRVRQVRYNAAVQDVLPNEKLDVASAVLDYVTQHPETESPCSSRSTDKFGYQPDAVYVQKLSKQIQLTVIAANIMNNMMQSPQGDAATMMGVPNYLLHSMCENDQLLHACTIASESGFTPDGESYAHTRYKDGRSYKDINLATQAGDNYASSSWYQKLRNSTQLLASNDVCAKDLPTTDPIPFKTSQEMGIWTGPHKKCSTGGVWVLTYSLPFFSCDVKMNEITFRGVVAVDFALNTLGVDQCAPKSESLFGDTHKCQQDSTSCISLASNGPSVVKLGNYNCTCSIGHYHRKNKSFPYPYAGTEVEGLYRSLILNTSSAYEYSFMCEPCANGCSSCSGDSPCMVKHDVMLRGIPLGIQSFCMTISVVVAVIIVRLRKTKAMKSSMWIILEIIIFGALLLYTTVVVQYFEPSSATCLLMPWFRELGFAIVYGALILKIYRILAEFQSRKAHRVQIRDKDLLKHLLVIVVVVIGYMSAWTALNLDQVMEGNQMLTEGVTMSGLRYSICRSFWWDYVTEVGELLFLLIGLYLCYCVRKATSDYHEARYVTIAIFTETILSGFLHIVRHVIWMQMHPDYIFVLYFIRCQCTVTIALLLVLGPSLWYAHRPPEDDRFRHRAYSRDDVQDTIVPETMKLQVNISSNGDVDLGEINLSDMDPEDIRSELKRLYTQLQIYKTKTMRKDNPHISKRRGGRKQTHRRFSLQAFHSKHRHHHGGSTCGESSHAEPEHELSKTPEESTNSGEAIQMDYPTVSRGEEDKTHSVTFRPGHKTYT